MHGETKFLSFMYNTPNNKWSRKHMLKYSFLIILLVACSTTKDSRKSTQEEIQFEATKRVFDNGLTAIIVENKKLPVFSYHTFYKVGGKFETPGITGASHFLEHMMFKGAKKYKMGEFDRLVEGNGGSNNAYTTNDLTVYYEDLPNAHLETMIDIEADRMENLTLDKAAFQSEKAVVLEERRMRYENSDRGKLYLSMMKEIFKGTAYGTSVIGKIEDLNSVTRDQIYAYFKKYYSPNNAVIVIAGDVDTDDTLDLLEDKFGDIKPFKALEKTKSDAIKLKGFKVKEKFGYDVKLKGQSPEPMFMLAYPSEKIGSREGFVLDILSSILGSGATSYLSERFVLGKNPAAVSISAANYTLQDAGVFFVMGQMLGKKNLKSFKRNLRRSVVKSCKDAITPRSIDKVKNQFLVSMFSGLDSNAGIAKFLGNREVYFDDYNFYKRELDIYQSITKKELQSACDKYLKPSRSVFLSIWSKHK